MEEQMQRPDEIIQGLLQNIFRIKNVMDAVIAVVAVATSMGCSPRSRREINISRPRGVKPAFSWMFIRSS